MMIPKISMRMGSHLLFKNAERAKMEEVMVEKKKNKIVFAKSIYLIFIC
ncbi:hypothetical protein [Mucilaginibacter gotjawali]|uniref:Uncharacterized protein n=1 Tax=Mucilaginibacter gotjawali TaxID=1550579 RepID=A0A839SIL9_9SPHI|nr:hypothetical protein [Mucilaginibacter gotjawali]MBB3057308.1 hypothetical protein [Mucilaginibacter gotjawali]